MELSKRLKSVAQLVTGTKAAADVGCDHGYVSIYLIRKQIAERVIAMDVREGPLARARQNVEREGLTAYIQTRLSDGLKELSRGEAETVICAGMGGRLIVRILSEGGIREKGIRQLVLQPQSEIAFVRHELYAHGFVICEENMVCEDGKYYQMMRAVVNDGSETMRTAFEQGLTRAQEAYGPCLLQSRNEVLKRFLLLEREKYRDILQQVEAVNPDKTGELKQKCLLIEEALAGYADEV